MRTRCRRGLCGWLAGSLATLTAAAGPVWHWVDATGQQHYSDHLPTSGAHEAHRLDTRHPAPTDELTGGLRSGELAQLQRRDARLERQRRDAETQRRALARTSAAQDARCRKTRANWHDTRDREQRKQLGNYLRRHCW
jgi:hypothetical protein